jgi:hypothetical protein
MALRSSAQAEAASVGENDNRIQLQIFAGIEQSRPSILKFLNGDGHDRENPMEWNRRAIFLGGAALLSVVTGWPGLARSQVSCEAISAGPARTDCYIGFSRINRQKSKISASVAQQQTDSANLSLGDRHALQDERTSFGALSLPQTQTS